MIVPSKILDCALEKQTGIIYSKKFLQGNEALAEGLLAAGADFFGGYPIKRICIVG